MFCEKCGNKLSNTANFCPKCGTNTIKKIKEENNVDDTKIQLKVKPTFKLGYIILPSLIIILIISLIAFSASNIESFEVKLIIFLIIFVIMMIALIIKAFFTKKQYENSIFLFYKTKVIYKDSFLNLSEKEIKYKYIREIAMRQSFFQKYFNIGNIILFTNAETDSNNGICITDVQNVQAVYKKIKSIIDL